MHTPRSIAVEAALQAGAVLRDYFGRLDSVVFKGATDIVTEADHAAEKLVLDRLISAFPDYAVLAEESGTARGRDGADDRWIVDPLDGTTNFANNYPHFCVSIALEHRGELELGVIYVPMLDELFITHRGQGVSLNGEPVRVSGADDMRNSVLATGFQYDPEEVGENLGKFAHFTYATRAVRRDGSAAIDLAYVAAGRFDGFWEAGLNPWDVAAGALMVVEAGGRLSDYHGSPYRIDSPDCVATNGLIHGEMLTGIESAGGRTRRG